MKTKSISRPNKHIPLRTCVACRQVEQKRGLLRIVRTPGGEVVVDITGKKEGRGAYLCTTKSCWEKGIIGGKVERSLKVTLSEERKSELIKLGEELAGEGVGG